MSFDELMRHAREIRDRAIDKEGSEQATYNAQVAGGTPAAPVDYDKIRQKFASIEQLFEPFSRLPDPARYDPMIADLGRAMGDLSNGQLTSDPIHNQPFPGNPKLDKMTTAGGYLQGWSGSAAMEFKGKFIDTFRTVCTNQFVLLATMSGALEAHQEMWRRAREDIDMIAHNTQDALDNAGSSGKNQWSFGFSVLSAVAAIGGVAFTAATGGAGGAIAIAAIGAAASTGSAGVASTTASGDSAEQIINSMRQAIEKLAQSIQEVETNIESKVQEITGTVNGRKDLFVAARPTLAGMNDGDLTGDGGMGTSD